MLDSVEKHPLLSRTAGLSASVTPHPSSRIGRGVPQLICGEVVTPLPFSCVHGYPCNYIALSLTYWDSPEWKRVQFRARLEESISYYVWEDKTGCEQASWETSNTTAASAPAVLVLLLLSEAGLHGQVLHDGSSAHMVEMFSQMFLACLHN